VFSGKSALEPLHSTILTGELNVSSFFDNSNPLYDGSTITSGLAEYGNEPRDPESGRLLKHLTKAQLDGVYARFPHLREHNIEPYDPNRALPWDNCSPVGTEPADLRLRAERRARNAALLADPAPTRHASTKPVVTELSKYRILIHKSSHACLANLAFSRPIVRVTINPDNAGNAGHSWNYREGDANQDDLVIVAAGRIAEEELLGDVFESGCSGDDEAMRKLALKLTNGIVDDANTLLASAEAKARALVRQYNKTIRRFALRLAAKREFILDEAEAAIKQAHEEVTRSEPKLDAEWKRVKACVNIRINRWLRRHQQRAV
jgi:hypothetical protein